MASIDDLGALVDLGNIAVDDNNVSALRRIVTKIQLTIGGLGPDVSTDQTFISYRTSAGLLEDALANMVLLNGGGIATLGAEF